jgi:entericidin A
MMKKLIAAIIAGSFLLTACNTMEGFGRDVEKTGDNIEKSAQRHK